MRDHDTEHPRMLVNSNGHPPGGAERTAQSAERPPLGAPRSALCAPAELPASGPYAACKRAFDVLLSLLMLVPALPLIILSACLVRLTSRGPVFYSQIRLGLNGRPFRIWKIRTMRVDSEKNGACWSQAGDPRVTRVGRFLRKTHLDELPQLWNVLRGDMSLVGPRPERPEFVPSLEHAIPRYRDRMLVRPGLTGLAQVQLPPDSDLESVRRKLACDLFYVGHLSLWLDLRLLVVTGFYVLAQSWRWPCRFLRIPGGKRVEENYQALLRQREREQAVERQAALESIPPQSFEPHPGPASPIAPAPMMGGAGSLP